MDTRKDKIKTGCAERLKKAKTQISRSNSKSEYDQGIK
jgi:hypothetical protein